MDKTVQDRPSSSFNLALFISFILLGINLAIIYIRIDQGLRTIIADVFYPIIDFLVVASLFMVAKHSGIQSRKSAIAWGMMALAYFVYACGDTIWAILEVVLKQQPFPSIADGFYLAYYPFFLVGVFMLTAKPATSGEKINTILDIGIVMIAAVLVFWNFLIGPIALENVGEPFLYQVILLAYPVGDLVLFGALLLIINNQSEDRDRRSLLLLSGSLLATIITDCIYTYQTLLGTFISGSLLDIGWTASTLLAGLAGISHWAASQSKDNMAKTSTSRLPSRRWIMIRSLLPYIWLVAAYALLIKGGLTELPMSFLSLAVGVGIIVGLVLVRQMIALSENRRLNVRLVSMDKYQLQAAELRNANQELSIEIAQRKKVEQKLSYDALHDALTGLANRNLFLDRLGQAIESRKRNSKRSFAILFIDLDGFKVVNDSLGHLVGDYLLIEISRKLKELLRSSDTIARFGGDEFEILLDITDGESRILAIAERIQAAIQSPFLLDGHEVHITTSIGIIQNITEYDQPVELIRDADIAMYKAKATGKAHFEIFEVSMRHQINSRLEIENGLRKGLENREFQLYYQPIINLDSNQIIGLEALLRWLHPKRGILLPEEFLSIAEESGLIIPIGDWVLNQACMELKAWQDKYPFLNNVSVNVNISSKEFSQPNLPGKVVSILQMSGLSPKNLKLEITEGVLISNYSRAREVFSELRDKGIQLQIDDFGTGYSALAYLRRFPINTIKIDKTFIDDIGKNQRGVGIIRAIVAMARELGMETVAEGIETGEQLSELKNLSCGFGQGFLLSKPLDWETTERVLTDQRRN